MECESDGEGRMSADGTVSSASDGGEVQGYSRRKSNAGEELWRFRSASE